MAPPRKTPDKEWLKKHIAKGLTQQEMKELWEAESGFSLSRSAIAVAMNRAGLTAGKPRPRYEDTLPWRVKSEHTMHSEARLLRLESRRRRGEALKHRELKWLTTWRRALEAADAVVAYDPDSAEGFFWTRRTPHDDDIVRRPAVTKGVRR